MNSIALINLPYPKLTITSNYLNYSDFPLNAGYLKSYLRFKKINNVKILFNQKYIMGGDAWWLDSLKKESPKVLIAFTYPWNESRTLYLINNLKEGLPDIKTIMLGSQLSLLNYESMKENKIDFSIVGGGELASYKIIQAIFKKRKKLKNIAGIIYKEKSLVKTGNKKVDPTSLNNIPSPFLGGHLCPIKEYPLISYETKRGCSRSCDYCYFGCIKIKETFLPISRIYKEILWAKEKNIKNVLFLDPIFNLPINRAIKICQSLIKINSNKSINFEGFIHPQFLNQEIVNLLKESNFTNLEIPLITIHKHIAENINFKINFKKWLKGIHLLQKKNLNFTMDIILGLPKDNLQKFKKTVDFLVNEGLNFRSECFFLSLHPSSTLASKAKKLKITSQKNAPYYILDSPDFPLEKIKEAYRYALNNKIRFASEVYRKNVSPSMSTYYTSPQLHISLQKYEEYAPWTKIILDLRLDPNKIENLISKISRQIACNLTIWIKNTNLEKDVNTIIKTLNIIFRNNPHTILNVIFEIHQPFSIKLLDKIRASIYKQPVYLDHEAIYLVNKNHPDYFPQSLRFYVLLSDEKTTWPKTWVKTIDRNAHLYRRIKSNGFPLIPKILYFPGEGVLLDFKIRLQNPMEKLDLIKQYNVMKKNILFHNLYLQMLWDKEINKSGFGENIITLNSKGRLTSASFSHIFKKEV